MRKINQCDNSSILMFQDYAKQIWNFKKSILMIWLRKSTIFWTQTETVHLYYPKFGREQGPIFIAYKLFRCYRRCRKYGVVVESQSFFLNSSLTNRRSKIGFFLFSCISEWLEWPLSRPASKISFKTREFDHLLILDCLF